MDIGDMLVNLSRSIDPIYRMVVGMAYVLGITFFFRALYHLKIYGELRTMMSSNTSAKEPLIYLFVGAIFVYFPTGFSMVMNTTFGYSNVLAYGQLKAFSVGTVGIALIRLIQLLGVIAFVRGWILVVKKTSSPGGGGEGYGKGIIHIIAGVAAMNIVGTVNMISGTFGL